MGAMAPMFTTRLWRPPVWMKVWTPGNRPARAWRTRLASSSVDSRRRVGGTRRTLTWPELGPALGLKAAPVVGTPEMETTVPRSSEGMTLRTTAATCWTMASVANTEVPCGAWTEMENWLSSVGGKNSVPIPRAAATETRKAAAMAARTAPQWSRVHPRTAWYPSSRRVMRSSLHWARRPTHPPRDTGTIGRRSLVLSTGSMVMETT